MTNREQKRSGLQAGTDDLLLSCSAELAAKPRGLHQALIHHGIGDLLEAGDIGSVPIVVSESILARGFETHGMNIMHDPFEMGINFLT
jgi:hypothetical protein